MGTLQRQQFHLGVTAQEICAYDNIKGVGVKHFAVLSHVLIAQIDGYMDPPQGMDEAGVPLVVVRPGREGEKQVARLSDTALPRAGQAALEEHRAVTSSWGGRENSARHKDFRGGSGPTSCLLAMKRHGPFSSPGHVRYHEPFFVHWDCAIPQPGYPQP